MDNFLITHPDKLLFPSDGISKGELAAYYEMIAPVMLPHLRNRPITMERFHRGINEQGFFQKDVIKGFPDWLKRVEVPKNNGTVHHPLANDTRSLLWLANQNSITIHVWPSRTPKLYYPDICVFDLDPANDEEPKRLRNAAILVRDFLKGLGLKSWIKTTGSKGFHIAVPLDGKSDFGVVARFSHTVGRLLVNLDPDNLTQEFSRSIVQDEYLSTRVAMVTAQRMLRRTQFELNLVRLSRHLVRGMKSRAVKLDQRLSL